MFYIFLFLSIACAILGIFFFIRAKKFLANSIITTAKVVNVEVGYDNKKSITVEYKDRIGKNYKQNLLSAWNSLEVGDEVEVLYDKTNPEKVRVNHFFHIYILCLALGNSTLVFAGILTYLIYSGMVKVPF